VGACGLAPAVVLDEDLEGKLTPEATLERVRDVTSRAPVTAEAKP
jgi:NADH:ubiquinone oxidoreductase subunit E